MYHQQRPISAEAGNYTRPFLPSSSRAEDGSSPSSLLDSCLGSQVGFPLGKHLSGKSRRKKMVSLLGLCMNLTSKSMIICSQD